MTTIIKVPEGVWPFDLISKDTWNEDGAWYEVTKAFWWEMLEVLPPIYFEGGFMVSEAYTHTATDVVYTALVEIGDRCFARHVPRKQAAAMAAALRTEVGSALTLAEGAK